MMKLFSISLILLLINSNFLQGQNIVELDTFINQATAKKDYELALKHGEQKLAKIKLENLHDTILANGLEEVAFFYQQLEDYEKSIETYKKVIVIQKKHFGVNHSTYAESLGSFAVIYETADQFLEAQKMYEEAILNYENSSAKKNLAYAKWANDLGIIYMKLGAYEKSEVSYQKALDATKNLFGEQHKKYVYSLNFLGHLYFVTNRYTKAEQIWLKALELNIKIVGKKHEDYGYTINFLGNLYVELGEYQKAEDFLVEALLLRKQLFGGQDWSYAQSLNNLSVLYSKQGKYEETEALMLESIEIRKNHKHNPQKATNLNNLATLYYDMGKYNEAETFYLESIAIEKALKREQTPTYASTLASLASLYRILERYKEAEDLLLESLSIRKMLLGENSMDYAISLHGLANLYLFQKKYAAAEAAFLKTQYIVENRVGKKHQLYAINLHNLGLLYVSMEKTKEAEILYLKSREVTAINLGKKHRGYLSNLLSLKSFYRKQKDYEKALTITKEFLDLSFQQKIDLTSIGDLVNQKTPYLELTLSFLGELSLLYDAKYREGKEIQYLQKKQEVLEIGIKLSNRSRIGFNSKKDKLSALAKTKNLVSANLKTVWELGEYSKDPNAYGAIAFNYAEHNKSMLLMDASNNQNAHALGDLPDSLVSKENRLLENVSELNKDIAETYDEIELEKLQKKQSLLGIEVNKFKQLLKDKYPKYHSLKYEDITVTAQEIQAKLEQGTAMIEYFVADSVLYAFYLSPQKVSWTALKISKMVLDSQVAKLHKSLSDYQFITNEPDVSYQLYTQTAHWFYSQILQPVFEQNDITKLQHLIIVADGELGNLPFEVFLTKEITKGASSYANLPYLIKKYKVSYNYSATLMGATQVKTTTNNNGEILAVAAQYGEATENLSKTRLPYLRNFRKALKPLPNAQKEVESIKSYMKGSFWTGKKATEANFKQEAGKYAVLHLAMHGLLNKYTPILSSLAFTEDGDSLEDNFLQAWEISKLQLNADLVVLSACETGYGRFEQGEGILSIARSFMYAGVPSLVVSLWSVNDASTARVMQNFYQNIAQKMDKSTALQQAKLSYIKNAKGLASHPAFWSPFIQIGNYKTIVLAEKSNRQWLYYSIGGLIFLLSLIVVLKRIKSEEN